MARAYGANGHVSADPVVLVKLMILLFLEDIPSERELMARLPERLDYLWFLDFTLDTPIPNHSVLSKARKRWGPEVFEKIFVQSVRQCVDAGLVDGRKLFIDSSLVDANASRQAIVEGPVELIAALKQACGVLEAKLDEAPTLTPASYEATADRTCSTTDPDATLVRKGTGDAARPRYHHHRAVDGQCGVITAVETTTGAVAENRRMMALAAQAEVNTEAKPEVLVADRKYGTVENFVAAQKAGHVTHMADLRARQVNRRLEGIQPDSEFRYDPTADTYTCPPARRCGPGGCIRCDRPRSI